MSEQTINISKVIIQCAKKAAIEIFNVTDDKLTGESRERTIVWARRMCMKAIREETALSLQSIANAFNKDHATILHAVRQHDAMIDIKDKEYTATYSEFRRLFDKYKAFELGDAYDRETMMVKRMNDIRDKIQSLAEEASMLINEYVGV